MKTEIIKMLYAANKNGVKGLDTSAILENLFRANKKKINVEQLFNLFQELLNKKLIVEVEAENMKSIHFEITGKGISSYLKSKLN
ncbi:MAG: hypothetical protein JKY54_05555 [Flavobacteriales bacterium]|nr:hypothetical protein [Flavobacteriales bacterium]